MNKKIYKQLRRALIFSLALGTLSSCKKMMDVAPEDALEAKQMYRNVYDADAAVLGVYGKFSALAEKYILLNGVRGDLMTVTASSNAYLRELSEHQVSLDNPYADPRPFYEVIVNCNDAMKNLGKMHDQKILDDVQYYQRYTDLGLLRSWLYLQLGIHYGTVPYVTDPLENINDLKDEGKFPRLAFEQLLDKLISFAESIPQVYMNQNTSSASPTLIMATNNYVVKDGVFKFFIHRKSFLGDLYLWKGNYMKAAETYKSVMDIGSYQTSNSDQNIEIYDTYRITNDNSGKNTLMTIGSVNPWPTIFSNPLDEAQTNRERMWTIPLDQDFAPGNPLVDLFSASRSYLVKPSQWAINNWMNQTRLVDDKDGGLVDRRGPGVSYSSNPVRPEVNKYLMNYDILEPFEKTGIWLLYRAAILHLRFAEAANRVGYSDIAGELINDGFDSDGNKYANYPAPFNFDGFKGTVNGNWYRSIGIRGRAYNQNLTFDAGNLVEDTEDKIINEEALETAFEGYRWADLLRIALRREATEPNYLADKIGDKFDAEGLPSGEVRARLSNKANWYLPFKWK